MADALNCQKETAKAIVKQKADYLLNVKDNHEGLKEEIETYIQDEDLRSEMDTAQTLEKNRGRIEHRIAFTTSNIGWIYNRNEWANLERVATMKEKGTMIN